MSEIKIISANCQGLGNKQKRHDVISYLNDKNANIICLQDTHFSDKIMKDIYSEINKDCYFSNYSSNARGVAIFLNKNFEHKVIKETKTEDGNMIALNIIIEGKSLTLINIYGPNNDSPSFYEHLNKIINEFNNENVIICGDFNLVLNPELDSFNYLHINNPNARKQLLEIIEYRKMFDSYRQLFPDKKSFTWHKKRPVLKQARLDYILISEPLLSRLKNANIHASYRSDHSSTCITLKFNDYGY